MPRISTWGAAATISAPPASRTIGTQTFDDIITELQIRHRFLTRTRDMLSGQVDFKTGDDCTHYVRSLVTRSDDVELFSMIN